MWMPARDQGRGQGRPRGQRPAPRDPEAGERAARAVAMLAALAVTAALWPAALAALAALAAASATGMHWRRLLRAAAWSTVMTAVYVIAAAVQDRPWAPGRLRAWYAQPYTDWRRSTLALAHGHVPAALLATAPLAVPAGLALAAWAWWWRCRQMARGIAGGDALAPVEWDDRQWRRQALTASRDAAQPGRVPLATRRGIPVGTVIRTVRAPWSRVLVVPLADFGRHMLIVGITGSGKTVLMCRMWAGWMTASLRAARNGGPPPLLVIIDCKGGEGSREAAATARQSLAAAGARVRTWPDDPLSLWGIPAAQLAPLLDQLIESGYGPAAYYADMLALAVRLALNAPPGPPRSAAGFLARLAPGTLEAAYAAAGPQALGEVAAVKPHLASAAARYRVLLDRLGPGLDGPGHLEDASAWYCTAEGTAEPSVAEAQVMALVELVARAAVAPRAGQRRILLAVDEYSAVSRRVPLSGLLERGRSLGLGVQASAQSWQGLGRDDDERQRIAATADGGTWLMRTPLPEQLVILAGTTRVMDGSRKTLRAGRTGDEGSARAVHTWSVDPNRVRQLGTGQVAWIRRGTATFAQVAPLAPSARTGSRAEGPPPPATPGPATPDPAGREQDDQPTRPLPPRPGVDDVLGPGQ
jgi:hypothetical protein